jgi:hypothetical protein
LSFQAESVAASHKAATWMSIKMRSILGWPAVESLLLFGSPFVLTAPAFVGGLCAE